MNDRAQSAVLSGVLFFIAGIPVFAGAQNPSIRVAVDLTDSPRQLFHADLDIPVMPGPVTLAEMKWLPGHHSPVGPESDLVGLEFSANGRVLPWKRDGLDLSEFHIDVPEGEHSIHAHLDCIVTVRNVSNVVAMQWEKVMLLPAGTKFRERMVEASVTVPQGWAMATALAPMEPYDVNHPTRQTVRYKAVTAERLQDSPVFAGQYAHEYELAPEITPKHYLDVFAAKADEMNIRPKVIAELANVVREAGALYASRHYNSYRFLLTLTKNGGGGTEHHESSDDGMFEDSLATDTALSLQADLLPHEFTHSWNGKFRRPAGEYVETFNQPYKTDLLWVYEGMTDFLGKVLAARSGLMSADQFKQALALEAAQLDNEPGRTWRSTDDTAVSVADFRITNWWASNTTAWATWRRRWDFYQEGDLLWLDVDTTIRKLTNNQKSFRDFLVLFLGVNGNTGPEVLPYTLDDIVSLLGKVAPYDWAQFFRVRVYDVAPHANFEGIEQAGYKVVYRPEPNTYEAQMFAHRGGGLDVWFSLGVTLMKDGTIGDVLRGGIADLAKLGPGEKIIAIGGRLYSSEAVVNALNESKASQKPIELIVQNDDAVRIVQLDYHDGPRYPAMVRVEGTPDYFEDLLAPMTKAPANP